MGSTMHGMAAICTSSVIHNHSSSPQHKQTTTCMSDERTLQYMLRLTACLSISCTGCKHMQCATMQDCSMCLTTQQEDALAVPEQHQPQLALQL